MLRLLRVFLIQNQIYVSSKYSLEIEGIEQIGVL